MGETTGQDAHQVVAKLVLPFALELLGRPEREAVVGWDSARALAYLRALGTEIASNAGQFDDCVVTAVRLGGGIATNVPAQGLSEVYRTLTRTVRLDPSASVTARAAIHNISGATMPWLRRIGVSRLDFEAGSLDAGDFVRLNRSESLSVLPYVVDDFLHADQQHNLGYVLYYGFDAPNTAGFRRSIIEFIRCPAVHLRLEPWEGWRVGDKASQNYVGRASQALEDEQLGQAREVLGQAGFCEYAPLAFARPGGEDPYLLAHAAGSDELQFGLSAQTRLCGVVSKNTSDWETYLAHSDDFSQITASVTRSSDESVTMGPDGDGGSNPGSE